MIKTRKELKECLELDAKALGYRRDFRSRIKHFFAPNVIWNYQKCLRNLEYYTNSIDIIKFPIWLYYKYYYRHLSLKLNFSIPINVFGPGLSIAHYGTIVVSPKAKIGKFCRIHACTNIGASAGKTSAPNIGDNVYIGPGAIIFGDISIANNVTIGANATVNKSCSAENVVLAGTPAKIVKYNYTIWIKDFLHS